MMHFTSRNPAVSAVIATNGKRPELLRVAVRSILEQSYRGFVEVVVVFDRAEPDRLEDIEVGENRALKIVSNTRSGGLAGGRNSGIIASSGEMIGFCDDDDYWMPPSSPSRLPLARKPRSSRYLFGYYRAFRRSGHRAPGARARPSLTSCVRAYRNSPSAMLYSREDLLGVDGQPARIGLVDEELPAAYGEDYDLLLRATRHGDVLSVPEPLILVLWDRPSFFSGKWQSMVDGLSYILRKFPNLSRTPRAWHVLPVRLRTLRRLWATTSEARVRSSARRRDPKQLRAWAAYVVSTGIIKPATLLDLVQKTGRGL